MPWENAYNILLRKKEKSRADPNVFLKIYKDYGDLQQEVNSDYG